MGKFITKFATASEYEAARENLILPNTSYIQETNGIAYKPYVPPFFAKLTLNNGEVVELQGSGELTYAMVRQYKTTIISAEIGELCTCINGAFNDFSSLTSITISDSVTSIDGYAFIGCRGLTSITIPDSVTSIDERAFLGCSSITNISIGSGITNIWDEAFEGCTSLISITCNATTAPKIRSYTFKGIKTGGTLYVPSGSTGYNVWMSTSNYYLGKYNWTKVEQ